jgi:hypothetical protein
MGFGAGPGGSSSGPLVPQAARLRTISKAAIRDMCKALAAKMKWYHDG